MRARGRLGQTLSGVAATLLMAASGVRAQSRAPTDEVTQDALKFAKIYTLLEQNYMDPLDPGPAINDGGIRGMLSALDPFSAFFDPDQFQLLQQQAQGEALGFGSILYVQPGKVLVLSTAQGSPSARAGLGPGDEILAVNGTRLDTLDLNSLIELLRQSRSHPARLSVIEPGQDVAEDFKLNPAEVQLPTVDEAFAFNPPGIGYVHIASFDEKTPQEAADAIEQLGGAKLKGLILDLRDNHGGLVDAAVGVASLFLKTSTLVLAVRGRAVPEKRYETKPIVAHFSQPVIVLVNGETASAAEVLAAALQDHDRAVIAGEPTYGKGVVQSVFPLSFQNGMALVTAQYFTPSGRSIQKPLPHTELAGGSKGEFHTDDGRPVHAGEGIMPDVKIPSQHPDSWENFLNETGQFTRFASDYITFHGKVPKSFDPGPTVLTGFKDYLNREGIQTPDRYWGPDQAFLKLRIKIELINLVYGLEAGNEVETREDPEVLKALQLFPAVPKLVRRPEQGRNGGE